MDNTREQELQRATNMLQQLDDKSLFLTTSHMNILLARQELDKKGDKKDVAQSNGNV